MTLRAGHYRAIQLFYDDGSPVLGPGGREVFVTRCGAELLGTRTDGGDATKNIATFLGIRRKTVAPSGPLTPVTVPGGVGTPGSGFEPGQGQIQGDGEGGLLTVGGGKLIVPEDKEIWVVKPCTRTPGPPAGPFPLGNHVATPLGVQYDGKPVYADGCVECFDQPCCVGITLPTVIQCVIRSRHSCLPEEQIFNIPIGTPPADQFDFTRNLHEVHACNPAAPETGVQFRCLESFGIRYTFFWYRTFSVNPFQPNYVVTGGLNHTTGQWNTPYSFNALQCELRQIQGSFSCQPFFAQITDMDIYSAFFPSAACSRVATHAVDVILTEVP